MKISRGRPSLVGWVAMGNLVLLVALIALERYAGTELALFECLILALSIPLNWPLPFAPPQMLAFIALAPINAYLWAWLVTWPFRKWFLPEERKPTLSAGKPNPVTLAAVGNLVLLATLVAVTGFFPESPAVVQATMAWLAFLLAFPLSGILLLSGGSGVSCPEQVLEALALAPVNCYLWARLVTWLFGWPRQGSGAPSGPR